MFNIKRALVMLCAVFAVISCSASPESTVVRSRDGAYSLTFSNGDGSIQVPVEERNKFVNAFARNYTATVDASFLINKNVLVHVREGATLVTYNNGTVEHPELVFEFNNPNAVADNEVVSIKVLKDFVVEITSATTGNIQVDVVTKDGEAFTKEIEIELSDTTLAIDKVKIADYIVPVVYVLEPKFTFSKERTVNGNAYKVNSVHSSSLFHDEHGWQYGEAVTLYTPNEFWNGIRYVLQLNKAVLGIERRYKIYREDDLTYRLVLNPQDFYKGFEGIIIMKLQNPVGDDGIIKSSNLESADFRGYQKFDYVN